MYYSLKQLKLYLKGGLLLHPTLDIHLCQYLKATPKTIEASFFFSAKKLTLEDILQSGEEWYGANILVPHHSSSFFNEVQQSLKINLGQLAQSHAIQIRSRVKVFSQNFTEEFGKGVLKKYGVG